MKGTVSYENGVFKGIINMGTIVKTGSYVLWIKIPQYKRGLIGEKVTITAGVTNELAQKTLIGGDINNDEKIDVLDFNVIASCFEGKGETESCGGKKVDADLNDDGVVDGVDYNLFLGGLKTAK